MTTSSENNLAAALAKHELALPPEQLALLDRYRELLWSWNEKLNLTRHTTYEKFAGRDVLDSMVFARFLAEGEKVLDVGSGGGVPGLVLAILRPDLQVSLSESAGKRARVLEDIVARLGLHTPVYATRAEEVLKEHRFNTLVLRAVGKLQTILEWFRPHWGAFNRLLILKGPAWVSERGEARHYGLMRDLALRRLYTYRLPDSGAESVLLQIRPKER